jgi:hypothetical protein
MLLAQEDGMSSGRVILVGVIAGLVMGVFL